MITFGWLSLTLDPEHRCHRVVLTIISTTYMSILTCADEISWRYIKLRPDTPTH